MSDIKWLDSKQLQITPPKRTKKVTGTRFATILGLNPWSTPFEMWCAITKTYEVPFEDTIYTRAGKVIEPKQIDYMRSAYAMDNLRTPTDVYGADYFNKTWGDFYPDNKIFGGMWDSYLVDENGKPDTILEFKTTKRSEDWQDDVPEYYALQAALYAYLMGVDDVIMVCSFLETNDYENPEKFKPSAKNTITVEFKVSERYPDFKRYIQEVKSWWGEYVTQGISPVYDEKKDAEILQALRTNTLAPETDIEALIEEAEGLKAEVDAVTATVQKQSKRLETINKIIKEHAMKQFRPGDKKIEVKGSQYVWTLACSMSKGIDKEALEKDGLLSKYETTTPSYRLTVSKPK